MKIGMILGLIGGVLALIIGGLGFTAADIGNQLTAALGGQSAGITLRMVFAIVLPIVCLTGAGLVQKSPETGAGLMAAAALGFLLTFGLNAASIITAGLAGVGAFLVFNDLSPQRRHAAVREVREKVVSVADKATGGGAPADGRRAHTYHKGVKITREGDGRIMIGSREFPSLDKARAFVDQRRS